MAAEQPKKTKSPKSRSAEQVVARNIAVASIYRKLIGLALIATAAAAFSIISAVSLASKRVPPQYVPVLDDGRLLPLVPLSKANMNQAAIANFSLDAIRALNTYEYINVISQINTAQQYFSPAAWSAYDQELANVGTLKAVSARKMIVSVRPTGDVRVVKEFVADNGVYVWAVEAPVSITYTAHIGQDGQGGNAQDGVVKLVISRVPTTLNPRGVAIQKYKLVENR